MGILKQVGGRSYARGKNFKSWLLPTGKGCWCRHLEAYRKKPGDILPIRIILVDMKELETQGEKERRVK